MSFFLSTKILKNNRNYRALFIGQLVSFIGTMITSVALPFQIYQETHSTLMVGLLSLAQLLPLLITALIGGTLADRHHRRTLLLTTESLLALGCLILTWNATLTHPHLWIIFLTAVATSAVNGLHRPALDSMTQQIVDQADFPSVSALSMLKYSVSMIGGPAIAAWLIVHIGLSATFLIDFFTFAISLIALLTITHMPKPQGNKDVGTFQAIKEGLHYAYTRQQLMGSYCIDFFAMILAMPTALFPAIAHQAQNTALLAYLYSAPAVGALIFALFSGWCQRVKYYGRAIAISAILWGVAITGFGIAQNIWIGIVCLVFAGLFDAASGLFRGTLWNETIPTSFRGRLAGIEMISYLSGPKLGDTLAGFNATILGVHPAITLGGVFCVAAVAVCSYGMPKFWNYRSPQV